MTDSELTVRRGRPLTLQLVLLVVALGLAVASRWILAGEQSVDIVLECTGRRCAATIDGGLAIVVDTEPSAGDRIGLYVYRADAAAVPRTRFREVTVRPAAGELAPARSARFTGDTATLSRLESVAGWAIEPDAGLFYSGPNRRNHAMLRGVQARAFRVDAKLTSPIDAGLMVHATDRDNGLVFVVRSVHNDAFFFRLRNGEPGPILSFSNLRELRTAAEGLRLAGLVAEVVAIACALGLAVGVAARRWPALSRSVAQLRIARCDRRSIAGAFSGVVFVIVFAGSALIGREFLGGIPHVPDETAYLLQAKIFASGQLRAPAPEPPGFFDHEHMIIRDGGWFSKYPPMFSALLAVGVWLGAPGLVNPVLAGLLAAATVWLAGAVGSPRAALLTGLLTSSSPFLLIMGANLMAHTATALFLCLALLATVRAVERARPWLLFWTGLAWGAALLTRPFTAAVVAVPIAGYILASWPRSERGPLARGVALGLLGAIPFVIGVGVWMAQCGAATSPYVGYFATDTLGFGPDKGRGWLMTWGSWGHTPAKALHSVAYFFADTAHYLLGWPGLLSVALLPIPFLSWRATQRGRKREAYLLLAVLGSLAVGHMFYWATQHLAYGARYWFSAVPGLLVLTAMGLDRLMAEFESWEGGGMDRATTTRGTLALGTALGGLLLWSLLAYLPARLQEAESYGGVTNALSQEIARRELGDAVVFVATEGLMFNDGLYMNDPELRRGPIFARDLPARRAELMARYPGFAAYTWDKRRLIRIEDGVDQRRVARGR